MDKEPVFHGGEIPEPMFEELMGIAADEVKRVELLVEAGLLLSQSLDLDDFIEFDGSVVDLDCEIAGYDPAHLSGAFFRAGAYVYLGLSQDIYPELTTADIERALAIEDYPDLNSSESKSESANTAGHYALQRGRSFLDQRSGLAFLAEVFSRNLGVPKFYHAAFYSGFGRLAQVVDTSLELRDSDEANASPQDV